MNKHFAPVLAAAAILGVVGGVAATQAFKPVEHPQQTTVELVRPAAVTPSTTTTAAPSPTTAKVVVKTTPKPKPASAARRGPC